MALANRKATSIGENARPSRRAFSFADGVGAFGISRDAFGFLTPTLPRYDFLSYGILADHIKLLGLLHNCGRGSWIRTNDLQYPKLPRYQAALYPDYFGKRYTLKSRPARRFPGFSGH
jgi:hypothetical protein